MNHFSNYNLSNSSNYNFLPQKNLINNDVSTNNNANNLQNNDNPQNSNYQDQICTSNKDSSNFINNFINTNYINTNISYNPSLVDVSSKIPPNLLSIFPYHQFNNMQSLIVDQALSTTKNMVVAAPTGSGKTVIHELAIVGLFIRKNYSRNIKCVYIAPNKALCQQKCTEWKRKFEPFQLRVLEVTGDIDFKDSLRTVAKASIIITTPEKWDSLTRSWKDHVFLLGAIDLLLLDEVHHLGEDRGPILEAVVVRMRMITEICRKKNLEIQNLEIQNNSEFVEEPIRIIALSATLPNLSDIGEWLNCSTDSIHYFDETFRPVPLEVHTYSYGHAKNPFLFEKSLDEKVSDVIIKHSEGKQSIIFCSSKKNAEYLAYKLLSKFSKNNFFNYDTISVPGNIVDILNQIQDKNLLPLLKKYIAYHHAGLPSDDRVIIEHLFLIGYIKILTSTSTLAHGINLPARLVIIKGTYSWRGSGKGYVRLSKSDVIQMLGRAGRPNYDTKGIAIIMTSEEEKNYYNININLSIEKIDSKLPTHLKEILIAEISQTVINNLYDCIKWLMLTFFFIRNKKKYLNKRHLLCDLKNICHKNLLELKKLNLIEYKYLKEGVEDEEFEIEKIEKMNEYNDISNNENHEIGLNTEFQSYNNSEIISVDEEEDINSNYKYFIIRRKPETFIMARNLIKCSSMSNLMKISSSTNLNQLLFELVECEELHKPLRRLEKKLLNNILKFLRYSIKEKKILNEKQKSFILLQASVHRIDLKDFTLKVEQAEIVESSMRLLKTLKELCIENKSGPLLESTLLLRRALIIRLWEGQSSNIFKQCNNLSSELLKTIEYEVNIKNTLFFEPNLNIEKLRKLLNWSNVNDLNKILSFINYMKMLKIHLDFRLNYKKLSLIMKQDKNVYRLNPAESELLEYHIIAYDVTKFELICYRCIKLSEFYEKIDSEGIIEDNEKKIILQVTTDVNINKENIRACILSNNYYGIDSYAGAYYSMDGIIQGEKDKSEKISVNNVKNETFNENSITKSLVKKKVSNNSTIVHKEDKQTINEYDQNLKPQDSNRQSGIKKESNNKKDIQKNSNGITNYFQPKSQYTICIDSLNKHGNSDNIEPNQHYKSINESHNNGRENIMVKEKSDVNRKKDFTSKVREPAELSYIRKKAVELNLDIQPVKKFKSYLNKNEFDKLSTNNNQNFEDVVTSFFDQNDLEGIWNREECAYSKPLEEEKINPSERFLIRINAEEPTINIPNKINKDLDFHNEKIFINQKELQKRIENQIEELKRFQKTEINDKFGKKKYYGKQGDEYQENLEITSNIKLENFKTNNFDENNPTNYENSNFNISNLNESRQFNIITPQKFSHHKEGNNNYIPINNNYNSNYLFMQNKIRNKEDDDGIPIDNDLICKPEERIKGMLYNNDHNLLFKKFYEIEDKQEVYPYIRDVYIANTENKENIPNINKNNNFKVKIQNTKNEVDFTSIKNKTERIESITKLENSQDDNLFEQAFF